MRLSAFTLTLALAAAAPADDWPQYLGADRSGVWKEAGILDKFPAGGPKLVWKAPVGQGYAGPAVADGRVFVIDRVSPDANLGSSARGGKAGVERVQCFDQVTGKQLWKDEYPTEYRIQYGSGPRCTPTVDGDRVYTFGAMGDLRCYAADSGKRLWARNLLTEYEARLNVWGFAAAPLVDGDKLICLVGGSGERLVVAFDKHTGKQVWASQSLESDAGYSPPVIYDLAGRRTLVIWHGRGCAGLDPATGKRIWFHPWPVQHALTAPMPRAVPGDMLFLTAFYEGPVMLGVNPTGPPTVVWKSKSKGERPGQSDGIHSIMPTSYVVGEHIYGVSSYGELLCQEAASGKTVWSTRTPTVGRPGEEGKEVRWGNAFLTPNGDKWFLFNEQGELIIAKLSPAGYKEIDRAKLLEPTNKMAGRPTVWCHPAYADRCVFVRNDVELVCYSLAR